MNLNFGEHYYEGSSDFIESILINFLGAFFGFGFALLIYYYTIQREKKKETENLHNELTDKLIYFYHLLKGSVNHINNLFEAVKPYIDVQRSDLLKLQILKTEVGKDINRLNNEDAQQIFLAYRHFFSKEKTWITDYQKIYKSIDVITQVELEINRLYRHNAEDAYKKGMIIKGMAESIPDKMAAYCLAIENQLGEFRNKNEDFNFLNGQLSQYHKLIDDKENASLSKIDTDFLEPLLREILAKHKNSEFANEILFLGKDVRVKIHDLKGDIAYYLNELEHYYNGIGAITSGIENECHKIENLLKINSVGIKG